MEWVVRDPENCLSRQTIDLLSTERAETSGAFQWCPSHEMHLRVGVEQIRQRSRWSVREAIPKTQALMHMAMRTHQKYPHVVMNHAQHSVSEFEAHHSIRVVSPDADSDRARSSMMLPDP